MNCWGLFVVQRGTTGLNIQTAFIHYWTSINITLHLSITEQCMVQPVISKISLCPMKSLFLLISSIFSFYFFVKFWNKAGLNKAGMDLMLLQGEMRPEWKRPVSGARVVRWPTLTFQKHILPYKVYGLDLQTSQLPLPYPHHETADQPWPLGLQIWMF